MTKPAARHHSKWPHPQNSKRWGSRWKVRSLFLLLSALPFYLLLWGNNAMWFPANSCWIHPQGHKGLPSSEFNHLLLSPSHDSHRCYSTAPLSRTHSCPVSCLSPEQVLSHSTPWECWCLITGVCTTVLYHLSNQSLAHLCLFTHIFSCFACQRKCVLPSPNEGVFNEPPPQRPQPNHWYFCH